MKLLTTLSAMFVAGTAAFADGHLPDLGGQEIVVVTENAYPPLQFIDGAGEAVGWEYDAMAEIAARINATVVYENISWDAMIPAVSEEQFDMGMTGITIRDDRKEVVDFSDTYMTSEMVMMVRGDEDRFTDAASFAADVDLLMAAQPGTTPFYVGVYDVLDGDEANPRIKLMDDGRGLFQRLPDRAGAGRGAAFSVHCIATDGTALCGDYPGYPDYCVAALRRLCCGACHRGGVELGR